MIERHPRIRLYSSGGYLLSRDGLSLIFYMRQPHANIARKVRQALDVFLQAVDPDTISHYDDGQGEWQRLDSTGWTVVQDSFQSSVSCRVCLTGSPRHEERYRFAYHGSSLKPLPWEGDGSHKVSTVYFWLPSEYLDQQGPGKVREFALELAASFPFCSGHAGLAFIGGSALLEAEPEVQALCFRYPGMDVTDSLMGLDIGPRVDGIHWLNFLAPPVLDELGGASGLRAQLHSPGTTVQDMEGGCALVTLGDWPEAGDTHQGLTLPAYQELAHVLEPWLYHRDYRQHPHLEELAQRVLRWERRFLDP